MRRGLILLVIFAALAAAPTVQAASWARPQIQIVVDQGLMGPSVAEFRAGQPLTRGELGYAMAVLTQQEQVVVDPERAVTMAELHRRLVTSLGLRTAAGKFRRTVANAGLNPPWRLGDETVARLAGARPRTASVGHRMGQVARRLVRPARADRMEDEGPETRCPFRRLSVHLGRHLGASADPLRRH
jgi:hypothetical protein